MNWTEIGVAVISAVAMLLTTALPFAIPLLFRKLKQAGIELDQAQTEQLELLAMRAVKFAEEKAHRRLKLGKLELASEEKHALAEAVVRRSESGLTDPEIDRLISCAVNDLRHQKNGVHHG